MFYIYDRFIEDDEPCIFHYWRVTENGENIPDYIRELETDVQKEALDYGDFGSADYLLGGLKADRELGKCCIFRVYPGGRGSDGRPGRWILLILELDLQPMDLMNALETDCFASYRIESGRPAPLPVDTPRFPREELLLAPVLLTGRDKLTTEQLRSVSLSLTSGHGEDDLLLVRKDADGKFIGSLHRKPPPNQPKDTTTKPNANDPPPVPAPTDDKPSNLTGILKAASKRSLIVAGFIASFLVGKYSGKLFEGKPDEPSWPVTQRGEVLIDGPPPGESIKIRINGGKDFSFSASDAKNTVFKLTQLTQRQSTTERSKDRKSKVPPKVQTQSPTEE